MNRRKVVTLSIEDYLSYEVKSFIESFDDGISKKQIFLAGLIDLMTAIRVLLDNYYNVISNIEIKFNQQKEISFTDRVHMITLERGQDGRGINVNIYLLNL